MNSNYLARALALACLLSVSFPPKAANADVFGRLRMKVQDVDDEKPINGAQVTLHDPSHAKGDLHLTTDASGSVTSPLLENRVWEVSVTAPGFQGAEKKVKVISDTVSDLEFSVEPIEETIKIASSLTRLNPNETSTAKSRDQNFNNTFPVSVQSPQQLTGLLLSNPGFVQDSANQVHPRGEHSATSIYIQGFQLGGAAQGRFGPLIDPQALENLDIMTGGFSPEYAGDSAVLNTTVRSGTAKTLFSGEVGGGNYGTSLGSFMLGGQAGAPVGIADKDGYKNKIFSYFLSGSARQTDNALESPQPHNQTAHNHGDSENLLGRFDLNPSASDNFSLILNASPAKTDVANRSGLPDKYAPFGQGYGFGGALSAEDAVSQGILSQDKAGQDIFQKDKNNFGVAQWRHTFNDKLTSLISLGLDESKLDTLNNNPAVDLANLPDDNSIEYNPTVKRDGKHKQVSGSLTYTEGSHSFKVGGQYSDESAADSYQLTPASQLATNALFAADSRLVGEGVALVDKNGDPVLDSQGNQVYQLNPGAGSPTLHVDSSGYYLAGFAQDTWKVFEQVTANYGIRYDKYHQIQNLGEEGVDKDQFSPRANLSWNFYPTWVARASYNRVFIEPPLSQGSIIGSSIRPERLNQYETSIEKEITQRQTAKVAYYYKDIQNQVDTGLLIPSTQLGLYTSVNLDRDAVHGLEFSYDLLPDHGYGTSAYVAYAYSIAKPSGFDNTGAPVEKYNDHDQRHTLSTGLAYTLDSKYSAGLNYYYGSGLASSILSEDGSRNSHDRIDFSLNSPPDLLFHTAGLRFTVANVLDSRDIINFNSAFSGTRFEQGRSFVLSTVFNF
jgi:outer membrane receptor protein involved in Fe transport